MNIFKLALSGILAAVLFGAIIPALVSPRSAGARSPRSAGGMVSRGVLEIIGASSSTRVSSTQHVSPVKSANVLASRTPSSTQILESQETPSLTVSSAQDSNPQQLRGLWVDAFGPGFKTPAQVDQLVQDAKTMRINALFMQVGRRGDCYCNRAAMPRSSDPDLLPNFDPLQYTLNRAHKAGIQVHAWIITTAIWNVKFPVGNKNHVFFTHANRAAGRANWLTENNLGERQAGVDYLLDPGHSDAAEFIAQEYLSVVKNYAVDGIMFDRVRYPDSGNAAFLPVWGYNPTALAQFQAATSRTDRPKPADQQWAQWRRDQITNLVRRVSLEAKAIKPALWVSAATITYREPPATLDAFTRTRTYAEVLQDWPSWTSEGILDLNVPMNYKREQQGFEAAWFDGWNAFAVLTRGNAQVGVGTAIYLNTISNNLAQLHRSLKVPGASGWVGYSYRTPDVNVFGARRSTSSGLKLLTSRLTTSGGPFEQPATWEPAPTDHLSGVIGRVTRNGQGVPDVPLELSSLQGEAFTAQSDSNGYYGAPSLPIGTLSVNVQGNPDNTVNLEIEAGKVTRAPDLELP